MDHPRHVVLSGCSGGGKSAIAAELARRGFAVVPEPGRRIVDAETVAGGSALPWVDMAAFARKAIEMAARDRICAGVSRDWTFFDRGLVDAAVALEHATGEPASNVLAGFPRYHRQVFLTPPWPDIFVGDGARRHGLEDGIAEYHRLVTSYTALDYQVCIVPKTGVVERADFVLSQLRE